MTRDLPHPRERTTDLVIAGAILLVVVAQSVWTLDAIGISWDEPKYFAAAKDIVEWCGDLGEPGSLSAERVGEVFGFRAGVNVHPTLAKLLGAASYALGKPLLGDFPAFRMASVILFGVLLAAIYLRVTAAWGRRAALVSVVVVGSMPRLFVHHHIAATDGPLTVLWFLTVWAFEAACADRRKWPLVGLASGLAMAVKFTGFLVIVPLLCWGAIFRRRQMLVPAISAVVLGLLVFLVLQPAMWDRPVADFLDFVRLSTGRAESAPHWMLFLGTVYDFSPPWYYAPFMTGVTVPEVALLLALLGAVVTALGRFRDPLAAACIVHVGFFWVLTMMPNAPGFDGVRLFLPSFVFIGILAGRGFRWLEVRVGAGEDTATGARPGILRRRAVALGLAGLVAVGAALPLLAIYPFGLEYYNLAIGGVDGARARGMETTYWWTVVNTEALQRIERVLPHGARLRFFPADPELPALYRELDLIRADIRLTGAADFDHVVVLSRPCWDYPPLLTALRIPDLVPVEAVEVDGVPFWILYRRQAVFQQPASQRFTRWPARSAGSGR
jgi:hypothetical protein